MSQRFFASAVLAAAVGVAGCTVHQTKAPALSGPSEFSLSVGISATPDSISQDGGSQSSIKVSAHDATGKTMVGQTFRLDILVNGSQIDYGTLSARTVVTGADGNAFAIYTAPAALPNGATAGTCTTFNTAGTLAGRCVSILATPSSTDFAASQSQGVEIRLMPPGLIIPAASTPTAAFTTSPSSPTAGAPVQFDASTSCGGALDNGACPASSDSIVSYLWNFGDGSTGSGQTVSHTYTNAQTYTAIVTVTNSEGVSASKTSFVTVGGTTAPTAKFTISPDPTSTAVVHGTALNFNADGSSAAAGHRIVQYSWDFGDGTTGATGASLYFTQHTYAAAAPGSGYIVTLTILDDAGGKATTTLTAKIS